MSFKIIARKPEANFPFRAATVPFILITLNEDGDNVIEYACTIGEKKKMFTNKTKNQTLLAVWPGQYSSDVFDLNGKDTFDALFKAFYK